MRWLSMGRSFSSGVESGRYKMAGKGAFPSFSIEPRFHSGPAPEPRSASGLRELSAAGALVGEDRGPEQPIPLEVGTAAPAPQKPAGEAGIFRQVAGPVDLAPPPDSGVLTAVKDWIQRKKRSSTKAAPAPRFRPRSSMHQSLLTLDGVSVVRNDLTDADYEVRPARTSRTPSRAAGSVAARSAPVLEGMAWSQAAARLFHSGRAGV